MKDSYWTWLRFFSVILIVLSPLGAIKDLLSVWQSFPPQVLREFWGVFPLFTVCIFLLNIATIFIAAYGIRVGFILWRLAPSGKSESQRYLILRLGLNLGLLLMMFMVVDATMPDAARKVYFENLGDGVVSSITSEIVFFTVWWLYFMKSKRVKATYG